MNTYTAIPRLTASAVCISLLRSVSLVVLYLLQIIVRIVRSARHLSKVVAAWLRAEHTFVADEDPAESVTMTGIQYVLFLTAVCMVTLLLSIEWMI